MRSIQLVIPTRKRLFLALLALAALALITAAFACYLQSAAKTKQRKQLAEVQRQLSVEMARQEELRNSLQNIREELDCNEYLRRENRKQGDHWLPEELDRMRHVAPRPAGEA